MSAPETRRNTKIVATIGPASNSAEMVEALLRAGVNMFRLNFSHGKVEDHRAVVEHIRKLEKKIGKPIAILADLQGPKLRIGTFEDGHIELRKGQTFRFDLDPAPGDSKRVNLPHPEILGVLDKDHQIFLDHGKVRALVTK